MTIAGVDFGRKRIGLAISDGRAAYPVGTIERRSLKHDLAEIRSELLARDVSLIVIGLPLSMDGTEGPSARAARAFAEHLGATMGMAVEMFDERLTSFEAKERLAGSPASRKASKSSRDAVAAAIILEGWLESRRPGESVR
jgi:putative Holliday junction resolvase